MSKGKLIPELRFPEFEKEGEWEVIELNDFCFNISSGKDKNSEIGKFELYGSTGIIGRTENASYNGDYILVARVGANAGLLNRAKGKFGVTDNTLVLDLKKVGSIDFIHYSLNKIGLNKLVFGSGQPLITGGQLKNLKLVAPLDEKEQQKIASCLSSLDEVITAHSQKLALLKDHKKGLMQNLFPQAGEKVPKYRFKEFEEDGEWEEKKLEGLAKRGSGHTPNKQMPNYYNGGIKWVSLADSNKLDNGYIFDTKIQISKDGIENSSAVIHPAGTVILSRDAGVGKSAVLYSEMAVSQHFIAWVCDEFKLSNRFLYYVFQILKPLFESIAVGSTIKTIGLPYFKELIISVPSISEQQKIASCLSSLDALIAAQVEKIAQLKLHKKGLMQGLFPKIND